MADTADDGPPESPLRVAAIDLGTNSVRLIIAEVDGAESYQILDDEREQTRLGFRLDQTGRLDPETSQATLDALERMKGIAEGFGARELRTVATAALREAENGPAFVKTARESIGIDIEVISAEEEAELAMRSVRRHFPLGEGAAAIVDIGGGSMEVVFTTAGLIDEIYSMPVGAVRMTERYVHSDPIDRNDWRALKDGIDREIKNHIGRRPFPTPDIIGSGGTFTAIGGMALHDRQGELGPVQGYVLTRAEFEHQLRRIREAPLAMRRLMPGLSPDRADIIVAGAVAVSRLAKRLDASRILINDRGVRDGLLLKMIARLTEEPGEKPHRMEAARAFARKCRSNVRHCQHVATLARSLFDGLAQTAELEPDDAELLTAAALMHDVGYLIRYKDHHLHAYHLIRHSDLDGFAAYELELIANLVRYHRRSHPSAEDESWARIREDDHERVRCLGGILRLADGLDRPHAQSVRSVAVDEVGKRTIHATVAADADPWLEIGDAVRKSDLLESAIGRKIRFRWAGAEGPGDAEGAEGPEGPEGPEGAPSAVDAAGRGGD